MGKYLDIARAFEARRAEQLSLQRSVTPAGQQPSPMSAPLPWPCPHCSRPAEIEDVCLSLDGTRTLTLWHCGPCQTWGVTPDTIRQPPVWVSGREQ